MKQKIYKISSYFSFFFGVLFVVSAFLLFFDPFSKFEFLFYFIYGTFLVVFHRYIARMFAYVLTPIIKLCIFILEPLDSTKKPRR